MFRRRTQALVWAAASSLLAACTVGPDYSRPDTPVPPNWSQPPSARRPASLQRITEWWRTFGDPTLHRLVTEALAANLDLKQTTARIRAARAERVIAVAAGLPILGARNSINRRLNTFSGAPGTTTPVAGGFGNANEVIDIFQLGFDAQWEIDVFGGIRRSVEAAQATIESEIENAGAVAVTLLGEVARNYVEVRRNQQQIIITQDNLRSQEESLAITRARYEAGLTTELDVDQAAAQAAQTRSQLPGYEIGLQQAIHQLSVLLGKEPNFLLARLDRGGPIPVAHDDIVMVLPSELLRRRPDIQVAERQLAAATAQVGVATAELYPKFNLTALLGFQNYRPDSMTPIARSWSVASALTLPLFNWGRIRANIEASEAQKDQLLLRYQNAVLHALKEVEDALVAYREEQKRRDALLQSVEANERAVEVANERYTKGLAGFLDVLVSERSLYLAQSELTDSQAQISENLVALYKALGGGWEAPARSDQPLPEFTLPGP